MDEKKIHMHPQDVHNEKAQNVDDLNPVKNGDAPIMVDSISF